MHTTFRQRLDEAAQMLLETSPFTTRRERSTYIRRMFRIELLKRKKARATKKLHSLNKAWYEDRIDFTDRK